MLLLDEPMSGLGQEDIAQISALIRKAAAERTVLMVEHNLFVVSELSDTITVMARGSILAEGPYDMVSKHPQVIDAYMGKEHRIDEPVEQLAETISVGVSPLGTTSRTLRAYSTSEYPVVANAAAHEQAILQVRDLHAWYGESHVLHGITFEVREGEVVTLLGRNGAGKTTTLRAIMGIIAKRRGAVVFKGLDLGERPSNDIAKLGIGYCPEERGIFASLNVEENLLLPPIVGQGGMMADEIYSMFPNLNERRKSQGTKLSGGEQQMLAMGRILRMGASVLLLDEPTEGLAPVIVQQICAVIRALKSKGFTILMVEQNFHFATTVADRFYVVEHGRVIDMIGSDQLTDNIDRLRAYLGV
jgi:branched-chain amino acid transport system ATP-binding protein